MHGLCQCTPCQKTASWKKSQKCMKCLPTGAADLVTNMDFSSHRRCEVDWKLESGSLELFQAPWKTFFYAAPRISRGLASAACNLHLHLLVFSKYEFQGRLPKIWGTSTTFQLGRPGTCRSPPVEAATAAATDRQPAEPNKRAVNFQDAPVSLDMLRDRNDTLPI